MYIKREDKKGGKKEKPGIQLFAALTVTDIGRQQSTMLPIDKLGEVDC